MRFCGSYKSAMSVDLGPLATDGGFQESGRITDPVS